MSLLLTYVRIITAILYCHSNSLFLATYRVQDTDLILYNNGSVVVSCQYCVPVAESVREGCYVIINNSDEGLKKTINITGSDEETITLESGSYTVTTYDLVNGSIKGPATAPIQLEVTIGKTIISQISHNKLLHQITLIQAPPLIQALPLIQQVSIIVLM